LEAKLAPSDHPVHHARQNPTPSLSNSALPRGMGSVLAYALALSRGSGYFLGWNWITLPPSGPSSSLCRWA
jgi:hypothetical protein